MYEHYEKHRTDNITDPELRQSRPISTISGWDQEHEGINLHQTQQIQQSQQVQTVQTDEYNGNNEKDDDEQQQKAIEGGRAAITINEQQLQKPRIASISDVYHKEINGETATVSSVPANDETTTTSSVASMTDEKSKLTDILEQQLGNPDDGVNDEESREIATEIVEEILEKSEKLLDDCKQLSDDMMNQHETAIIKDEELEQAVHEVVSGVRQIQLKAETETSVNNENSETKVEHVNDVDEKNKHKTDETTTQESAIIINRKQSDEEEVVELTSACSENVDDVTKESTDEKTAELVQKIVNEIIDESVNKTEINSAENVTEGVLDVDMEKTKEEENIKENEEEKVTENKKPEKIEAEKIDEDVIVDEKDEKSQQNEKRDEETPATDEQVVKEVINDIIDDAVKEIEEQNSTLVDETKVEHQQQPEQQKSTDDDLNNKIENEIDVANNNIVTTITPEPTDGKIHFSSSNDSALPSSLSDDSPINENKTNNSTPSPTTSTTNEQNLITENQNMQQNGDDSHKQQRQKSTSSRPMFSPGPTRPPFRIPEFKWSYIHQRLLSDVLFSLETDIQVWRSHSTKSVLDFVNSAENAIFVVNTVHLISQLADNLIIACGGLLPLLASATSPNSELDVLEPTQGMPLDVAVSFLQRLVNMADVLVFASSLNFGELEAEKNMSSGGILRQCLRLVSTCAVRNCLECKERTRGMYNNGTSMREIPGAAHLQALIRGAQTSPKSIVDSLTGPLSPVKDPEKLLQDMDVNRLRAVIYRDVVSRIIYMWFIGDGLLVYREHLLLWILILLSICAGIKLFSSCLWIEFNPSIK